LLTAVLQVGLCTTAAFVDAVSGTVGLI
jgi:hypothetical protein